LRKVDVLVISGKRVLSGYKRVSIPGVSAVCRERGPPGKLLKKSPGTAAGDRVYEATRRLGSGFCLAAQASQAGRGGLLPVKSRRRGSFKGEWSAQRVRTF
jgi:hypothetical protein